MMNLRTKIATIFLFGIPLLGFQNRQSNVLENGKNIFQSHCTRCHGDDGNLKKFGASNLKTSKLDDDALSKIIRNGNWFMPKWKNILSHSEISAVVAYIKILRNN